MNPAGTESVQVPGIAPDWSPELLDLNQRLLEEISNVQLRMVEVLRENFQLKTDLEIAREALYAAECSSQRKYKNPIPTVQRKKSPLRYIHGYELVAKPYLPLPITAEDLKRSVDDMIHLVGDLNSKAPLDDPRDHLNSSPSNRALPPPSYLGKGGGWWPGSNGPTVDDIAQTEEILSRKLSLTSPDGGLFNLADNSPRPVPPPVVNAPSRSSGSGSKRDTPGAIFKVDNNKDEERYAQAPNNVMSSAEQAASQQEIFRQLTLLQSFPGKTWLSNETLSAVSSHRTGANDADIQEDAESSAPKSVPEEH